MRPGSTTTCVLGHRGEQVPATLDAYAALVVLGGEMGAHDDAEHALAHADQGADRAYGRERRGLPRDLPRSPARRGGARWRGDRQPARAGHGLTPSSAARRPERLTRCSKAIRPGALEQSSGTTTWCRGSPRERSSWPRRRTARCRRPGSASVRGACSSIRRRRRRSSTRWTGSAKGDEEQREQQRKAAELIRAADEQLQADWRPLAERFAEIVMATTHGSTGHNLRLNGPQPAAERTYGST